MNYRNCSDDVVVIDDLFRQDLGVPVRMSPGEVLDLESLCGKERVERSERLADLVKSGALEETEEAPTTREFVDAEMETGVVEYTCLGELFEKDREGLDLERLREQTRVYPFGMSISLVYSDGTFKLEIICKDCNSPVSLTSKGYVCPSCQKVWDPEDVLFATGKLKALVLAIEHTIKLWLQSR